MFRAGQLHVTGTLPPAKVETWRRENPQALQVLPAQRNATVVFNPNRPPFTDPRVRRALALAIDRNRLAKTVGSGRIPARNYTPPDRVDYSPADAFRDDPVEARRLLAEAGFPDGKGFPHVDVVFCDLDQTGVALEIVQQMWRKELGIDVGLAKQEWSTYLDSEKTGQYFLAWDSWRWWFSHAYFDNHRTGNPISYYLWSNADYDQLLRRASAAASIPERNALYAQLEAILAREMPAIPLYFDVETFLKHPAVHGWPSNPDFKISWKEVWLEQ